MNTINVYDKTNNKRLLGKIDVSALGAVRGGERYFNVAVPTPMAARYYTPGEHVSPAAFVDRVTFDLAGWEPKEGSDGWEQRRIATTDAPLDVLMRIRPFSLPGETEKTAERRRYYA